MSKNPIVAGKSSFGLIDPCRLFSELQLERDFVLLDLACGNGAYSIAISKYIGNEGKIYALDLWKEGIDNLTRECTAKQINNIYPSVTDVSKNIPIANHSVDVCLMATVLHDLIQDNTEKGTLKNVKRVLKINGLLAIIEFKKIEGPPGPPLKIRVSPEDIENILYPYGFRIIKTTDVSEYNYLSIFQNISST